MSYSSFSFRAKKELEQEIASAKELLRAGTATDEDLERRLYLNMLNRFVHVAQGIGKFPAKLCLVD